MLIPKERRIAILQAFFNGLQTDVLVIPPSLDGIMVTPKTSALADVQVRAMMKSLCSRGLARETFVWKTFYYYLTPDGVEYLRSLLHLDSSVVPLTARRAPVARPPMAARPATAQRGSKFEYRR